MPTLLPGVADARTRVAIWNALQLAMADAELDPAIALDIITAALPAETDDTVLARVGRWANRTVAGSYLPDAARPDAFARIADAMHGLAAAAEPGSGRQLAAARVAVAASADVPLLRGWLAGDGLPAGLTVDTELRWTVLERLALLGDVDGAEIDAAAAADHSSHGAVHAAKCRASRPDAAAKAEAWAAMLGDPDVPNYELYALAEGFWIPASANSPPRTSSGTSRRSPAPPSCARAGWSTGSRSSPTRGPRSSRRPPPPPATCSATTACTPASAARWSTPATTSTAPSPSAPATAEPPRRGRRRTRPRRSRCQLQSAPRRAGPGCGPCPAAPRDS